MTAPHPIGSRKHWVCLRMRWKASPGNTWTLLRQVQEMLQTAAMTSIAPAGFEVKWDVNLLGNEVVADLTLQPFAD